MQCEHSLPILFGHATLVLTFMLVRICMAPCGVISHRCLPHLGDHFGGKYYETCCFPVPFVIFHNPLVGDDEFRCKLTSAPRYRAYGGGLWAGPLLHPRTAGRGCVCEKEREALAPGRGRGA